MAADAPRDRVERAIEHQARHISVGHAQALVRADRMTAVFRHGPSAKSKPPLRPSGESEAASNALDAGDQPPVSLLASRLWRRRRPRRWRRLRTYRRPAWSCRSSDGRHSGILCDLVLTQTTVSVGHFALASASVENSPAPARRGGGLHRLRLRRGGGRHRRRAPRRQELRPGPARARRGPAAGAAAGAGAGVPAPSFCVRAGLQEFLPGLAVGRAGRFGRLPLVAALLHHAFGVGRAGRRKGERAREQDGREGDPYCLLHHGMSLHNRLCPPQLGPAPESSS